MKENSDAIKMCFEKYRKALLIKDGQLALEVIDSSTIQYYKSIIKAVKKAKKEEVLELGPMEKYFILTVRHRVSKEIAIKMTGESLFAYGVSNGWTDADEISNTILDNIKFYKNTATATAILIGESENSELRFIKENDIWKIDISGVMPEGEILLKKTKEHLKMHSYEEVIFYLIRSVSDREITDDIWIPYDLK